MRTCRFCSPACVLLAGLRLSEVDAMRPRHWQDLATWSARDMLAEMPMGRRESMREAAFHAATHGCMACMSDVWDAMQP